MSDWMMPLEAFSFLKSRLRPGAVVVELGSGQGTATLCEFAEVYSIEHDINWIGKARDTHYIHAPILGDWYDPAPIAAGLPAKFDCLIVDGPPGAIGRMGLLRHMDLFGVVPMLVDDVHRSAERELAIELARLSEGPLSVHYLRTGRAFATIGWAP